MNSTQPKQNMGLLDSLPSPPSGKVGWPWTEETDASLYVNPPISGNWPRISIVCPSFRQGHFIEETIRSVLLQNYPCLEFIIMDGGSDDETITILQNYARWLFIWESRPDNGQSHALNKGFAHASGQLFGWINSDDYYLPSAFANVAQMFSPKRRELLFGDWQELQSDLPELRLHRQKPCFAFQVAVGGRTLPSHATFWPSAVHQPFQESLRFIMDADLFKRFAAAGVKPRHIPKTLAVFRKHPLAKTSTLANVAAAETAAWSRNQPWHTHWRWLISRWIDRLLWR